MHSGSQITTQRARRTGALTSSILLCCAWILAGARLPAQELSGSDRALGKEILSLLQRDDARRAFWGIEIVSAKDGKVLVGWNEDKLFVPASTAKLFVASAALARLGPDYTYRTTVESAALIGENGTLAGDLVLVGRGDPNLSARVLPYSGRTERTQEPTKAFQDLARALFARGLRNVQGDLIADDSYFIARPFGPGWDADDLQWGYGAPVSALAINDNVTVVHILPGPSAGQPASIRLEPLASYYELQNRLMTVPRHVSVPGGGTEGGENLLGMDRRPGTMLLRVWGQIPEKSPEWLRAIAIEDPARYAAEVLRQELSNADITVQGAVKVQRLDVADVRDLKGNPLPPPAPSRTVLALHESGPLLQSLQVMLKVSQNLHAEMLLRTLGHERRNVGSEEAGLEEVKQFLSESGVHQEQVLLQDGAGLSRQDLVTPAAMAALLRSTRSQWGAQWTSLLPIAGQDGSLAERLKGRAVAGRVVAKTGTLSDVAALAGYIGSDEGKPLVFAIFVNHHNMSSGEADALMDRIVELAARRPAASAGH